MMAPRKGSMYRSLAPLWSAALALALLAGGCDGGDKKIQIEEENRTEACDEGMVYLDGRCQELSDLLQCGQGTVKVDGECQVASDICGVGTVLVEGVCQAETAPATCGEGTELIEGICQLDFTPATCGAGTELIDGICQLDFSPLGCGENTHEVEGLCNVSAQACGNGTELVGGKCELSFTPLACGDDTIEVDDQCHTSFTCGEGTVRVDLPDGLSECWDPVDAYTDISIVTQKFARNVCESFFRCCQPLDIWTDRIREGDFQTEYQTCVEKITIQMTEQFQLLEGRVIQRDEPGSLTVNEEFIEKFVNFYRADDACNIDLSREIMQMISSDNGPRFYWTNRELDAPCMTDYGCALDFFCKPQGDLGVGTCTPKGLQGDECHSNSHCDDSFYCNTQASPPYCSGRLGAGGTCIDDRSCRDGFSCYTAPEGKECQQTGNQPDGYSCISDESCGDGYYCKWHMSGGRGCEPITPLGEQCNAGDCGPYAVCLETDTVDDEGNILRVCSTEVNICDMFGRPSHEVMDRN